MPMLRCTEQECGHMWFERSALAEGTECEVCGEPTELVGVDDDAPAELAGSVAAASDRSHPAHARAKAREVAKAHGFVRPPVVVHTIARTLGFTVHPSHNLGTLRARLVGDVIEVNANEPVVAQRFSVAHELGHHFLGTLHGSGQTAEREADAFAGELLVSGPMLREALRDTTDARELRDRFKVSRDVLRIAAETHRLSDRITGE
jgi:hypothetical protein